MPSRNVAAGVTTDALTTHELRQLYLDWRDAVVEQCPQQGDARVRYPETNNDTRSEGIGYGMVIAAYMGDQQTFDGLWGYYQRLSTNGLMNWKRNDCAGNGGGGGNDGSASDADIDAALALIVADRQFPGNNYGQDAGQLLGAICAQLFNAGCQGVLMAGSLFGGCNCVNPSYILPGYYVAYGNLEQQAFWTQARDASYNYFNATRDDNTGLVPAWSQVDGNLQIGCGPQVAGGGGPDEYQADAARTPWRVATDYQWTGDPRAQDFLQSIAGFASSQQIVNGDFEEGMTGWSAFSDYYVYDTSAPDANTFTNSDGFALHQSGEMRLRVVRAEPTAPSGSLSVKPSTFGQGPIDWRSTRARQAPRARSEPSCTRVTPSSEAVSSAKMDPRSRSTRRRGPSRRSSR